MADFYEAIAQAIEAEGLQQIADSVPNLPVPDPFKGMDEWLDARMTAILEDDPVRIAGRFRGATTANLPDRELVASIEAPTLILVWTGDPSENALELLEAAKISLREKIAPVV